ncbi:aspartokinase/homoserine dehydrogenase 1 [Parabacteroides sp. PF5-5]|uniref:bifunctional aspartate kinase/homoserine dehydrogenase I n=1 Tax=unclassified Parabacteroides TaxID=2649774 RepID=UPI00247625D1|nr:MULTISPECIES: bifunctional aspartate kinase/homoserine dehydrogenase I [unclassified Parabacteroides]MDH6304535.1 aspartokinase/homoserine dehydrogenase 1 [Parabacteroides sp. PH5-39]MDH6315313.1 aspartokinase/homoserine dehydrogenase 1 [Parabacteroides sp. PF5-13]MDH6319193.1 aspartokinase/homoserine dehydrogenase 1 [Parabacteroides sp. PH5-13]MDH6322924.1 aspartokinase/homoserine dehydrogenase 1 [Parabacteroides sp. PH5-8]MDH6326504.1 aspartokinase/homoserine dehydrogenase 1 [Parabacteroi
MKVLKFGGTSVGSVNSILNVKKIVEAIDEPVVVIVSALGGITDKLLNTSVMASKGDVGYERELSEIIARHLDVIEGVIPDDTLRIDVQKQAMTLLDELSNIYKGVYLINDLSPKTSDTIVSYGERISSLIISHVIKDAKLFDSRKFIKTVKQFNKHMVDFELTNELIKKTFTPLPKVSLVPGFISSSIENGEVTNLGRGGSDYTAAILATALDASILEIWTDVDGFMTADPRVISSAYVIDRLSFTEAMELCNFGAKVIYPPTIYPVYHKNIPIRIRNTFNPEAPGTYISKERSNGSAKSMIKGISSINDTCLITVQGLGMVGIIGINYRIFKTLAKNGISVFMVSQASSENNTTFAVRNADAELSVDVLNEEFAIERAQGEISEITAEKDLATVAIVGENMKRTPGIAGRLFGTLGRAGISVIACAQGASETNISFVIKHKYLRKALNSIHDSFFLSEYKVLNLFLVGIGTVGKKLLEQIRCQQATLMEQNSLKLRVVGIANSKKLLLDRQGLNLETCIKELKENGEDSSPQHLCDEILKMNIFNSVFIDCTASAEIAEIYSELLKNNISVVAANKVAASSSYINYSNLKDTARQRDVKFLFETNVGAGLPIINTMNDLRNSGDHILKLEAVLSGTLNFIFNTLSADIPFSKAIQMAKEANYAEPDPRVDLSGKDVIRKLVILTREAGYKVEQKDVKVNLFIPEKYFEGTQEDFWKNIKELDTEFEAMRKRVEAEKKHIRLVAKMEKGVCEIGLQEVDRHHPFYELEGSNNIIMISTERYYDYPMIIKGYGAGEDVTAAGVFSDIISIANIR